jgi:hypothetical protein
VADAPDGRADGDGRRKHQTDLTLPAETIPHNLLSYLKRKLNF